jgi:hypothetical protein
MVSGISSVSSFTGNMAMGRMRPPDPEEQFKKDDVNGDGGLDKTEMQNVLDKISKMSGQDSSVSVDELFNNFDSDGDGLLSQQETKTAMDQLREKMGPPPQTLPDMGKGVAAYESSASAGDGTESSVLTMLKSLTEDEQSSLFDAITGNSKKEETGNSNLMDMLKNAFTNGSYTPLDKLA